MEYSDPLSSPKPGPTSAMDPLDIELSALMSPQEIEPFMVGLNVEIGDEDLYGILNGSNDAILDELYQLDSDDDAASTAHQDT